MKLVLVNTFDTRGWQIHRVGCKDLAKLKKQGSRVETLEAVSPEELRQQELSLGLREQGYSEADIHIMPCSKEKA